jgi:hypothetical protein
MEQSEIFEKSHEFHQQSMDISTEAFRAQKRNAAEEAKKLFQRAFELEREAALLVKDVPDHELPKAILFRSAAWIAFHAEEYREAERMAAYGLMGNPPDQLVKELREVLVATLSKLDVIELATAA